MFRHFKAIIFHKSFFHNVLNIFHTRSSLRIFIFSRKFGNNFIRNCRNKIRIQLADTCRGLQNRIFNACSVKIYNFAVSFSNLIDWHKKKCKNFYYCKILFFTRYCAYIFTQNTINCQNFFKKTFFICILSENFYTLNNSKLYL